MSSDADPTPPHETDAAFGASVLNFTEYLIANYDHDIRNLRTDDIANYWVVTTTCFGALSVCAGAAVISLLTKRSTTRSKTVLLTLITAMYVMTTLFLATSLHTFAHNASQAKTTGESLAKALGCLQDVVAGRRTDEPYSCAKQGFPELTLPVEPELGPKLKLANAQTSCASAVALVFNVSVGDAIVWWRAWAVWQGNMTVSWLGVVFGAATLAAGLRMSIDECSTLFSLTLDDPGGSYSVLVTSPDSLFDKDEHGIAVSVLSLIANVMATSLIAHKTWQHRRLIREHFKSQRRISQVEKTLYWIVESGVVFILIWVSYHEMNMER